MFRRSSRGSFSPERLFRRLDHVAAQINPILMVIVVGLLVLNLVGAALALVSHLPITRAQCALTDPSSMVRFVDARTIVALNQQ